MWSWPTSMTRGGELSPGNWCRKAVYLHTDVTREADIRAAIDLAVSQFGRLDCMMNNAGGAGMFAPIQDIPVEAFDRTIALLLRAAFISVSSTLPR